MKAIFRVYHIWCNYCGLYGVSFSCFSHTAIDLICCIGLGVILDLSSYILGFGIALLLGDIWFYDFYLIKMAEARNVFIEIIKN